MKVVSKGICLAHLLSLCLVKSASVGHELCFQISETIDTLLRNSVVAQIDVAANDLFEQVGINHLAVTFFSDLEEDCVVEVSEKALNDYVLELLDALVSQVQEGVGFDVMPVQVLEEPLHPANHNLVVFPPKSQLVQKFFSLQFFKLANDFPVKITLNRLGVSLVKLRLIAFNLGGAQVVDLRVKPHIILLTEK